MTIVSLSKLIKNPYLQTLKEKGINKQIDNSIQHEHISFYTYDLFDQDNLTTAEQFISDACIYSAVNLNEMARSLDIKGFPNKKHNYLYMIINQYETNDYSYQGVKFILYPTKKSSASEINSGSKLKSIIDNGIYDNNVYQVPEYTLNYFFDLSSTDAHFSPVLSRIVSLFGYLVIKLIMKHRLSRNMNDVLDDLNIELNKASDNEIDYSHASDLLSYLSNSTDFDKLYSKFVSTALTTQSKSAMIRYGKFIPYLLTNHIEHGEFKYIDFSMLRYFIKWLDDNHCSNSYYTTTMSDIQIVDDNIFCLSSLKLKLYDQLISHHVAIPLEDINIERNYENITLKLSKPKQGLFE